MQQITFMDRYPVFTKKIVKSETSFKSIDEIIAYLREKIEADPIAIYIGIFDHYTYTSGLENHEIADEIKDAKNIMCCFGDKLLVPEITAVRPRSFGVVLMEDTFVVSFLHAPSPKANATMIEWVENIVNI
ncbi:DUF6858 family protein [Sulfurovum sp.]|uniref:DUF6858 family protein n=1 Tax=Sulfurovum sp. TaxID=1969726 RepID=UPI00356A6981